MIMKKYVPLIVFCFALSAFFFFDVNAISGQYEMIPPSSVQTQLTMLSIGSAFMFATGLLLSWLVIVQNRWTITQQQSKEGKE